MKVTSILFLILFFAQKSFSQIIFSPQELNFENVFANQTDSIFFTIKNIGENTIFIHDINSHTKEIFLKDTIFTIAEGESISTKLYFSSKHNLTYKDFLTIENIGGNGVFAIPIFVSANYIDTNYSFTKNLKDEDLKIALHSFTNSHTSLSYNTARDKMFETIDDFYFNDTIECVYTGRKIFAQNRAEAQNQNFNTEHTWPQSMFGSNLPMQSDLYHLYPTDETANSVRSNFPFGFVVQNITWQNGGSKLGKNSFNQTVFEPRDLHKGNVSRSLFYFIVRYDSNFSNFIDNTQEFILKNWNSFDIPDEKEIVRNNRIFSFQNKRNPFIDHPEFIERITKFNSVYYTPKKEKIFVSENFIDTLITTVGDTNGWNFVIGNLGNDTLKIFSMEFSTPNFSIENFSQTIFENSFQNIKVKFHPIDIAQNYFDTLKIFSTDENFPQTKIPIFGILNPNFVDENNFTTKFYLQQNFPNPFNPKTVILFSLANVEIVSLKIYDILGREVVSLINNERYESGTHKIDFDANNLNSGIYFYKLTTNNFSEMKKLILTK